MKPLLQAIWKSDRKAFLTILLWNIGVSILSGVGIVMLIPLLNMLELTCQAMADSGICLAGLLATNGTVQTGVYAQMAERFGITLLTPDPEGQAAVMELIYQGVKAGAETFDTEKVCRAVDALRRCGAETIVLGCTELPLAVELYHLTFPSVDPTLELAKGAIRFVGGAAR